MQIQGSWLEIKRMWSMLKTMRIGAVFFSMGGISPVLAAGDMLTIYENTHNPLAETIVAQETVTEDTNTSESSEESSDSINVAEICTPPENINETELVLPEGAENLSAWIDRGQYLFTKKQYPEALTAYARAIALDPNNSEAWIGCGTALQEMEESDRAIAALNQALNLNPNSSRALLTRGLIYKEVEQFEEALADFENALEADQDWGEFDRANVAINLGSVLWRLDRPEEAISAFEQATEIDNQFALAWFNLGTAWLQQASQLLQEQETEAAKAPLEQAINAYDQALASQGAWGTSTGPASAWYNRGVALELLEKYEEAMDSYDRALRITPNHTKARQRLAGLRDR